MDLKASYDARVANADPTDHLSQVGHTVNGAPISETDFAALHDQIADLLALGPEDRLLDLCCGNGLFTQPLAQRVAAACGADLSPELIRVARLDHPAPNLDYVELDACAADRLAERDEAPFTRVLIYAAWQHFDKKSGAKVLDALRRVTTPDARVLLGFVLDAALKNNFFDTPERRTAHEAHVAAGTDLLGVWWDRDDLTSLASECGFTCAYANPPAMAHAARYRFNALLIRT